MVKVPRLTVRAKLLRRHCAQKHINGNGNMSSYATKVDSCSSGSTIGSEFEDWLEKPRMKIVHMVMWSTEAVLYMYGVVSLIWEKNLLVRSGTDVTGAVYRRVQLGVVVQNLRQQIPLERVQTLVSSMPSRVCALVDPRGSSTRY